MAGVEVELLALFCIIWTFIILYLCDEFTGRQTESDFKIKQSPKSEKYAKKESLPFVLPFIATVCCYLASGRNDNSKYLFTISTRPQIQSRFTTIPKRATTATFPTPIQIQHSLTIYKLNELQSGFRFKSAQFNDVLTFNNSQVREQNDA